MKIFALLRGFASPFFILVVFTWNCKAHVDWETTVRRESHNCAPIQEGCMTENEAENQDPTSPSYMSVVPLKYFTERTAFGQTEIFVVFWADGQSKVVTEWSDENREVVTMTSRGVHTSRKIVGEGREHYYGNNEELIVFDRNFRLYLTFKDCTEIIPPTCIPLPRFSIAPGGDVVYASCQDAEITISFFIPESWDELANPFIWFEFIMSDTLENFDPIFNNITENAYIQSNGFINSQTIFNSSAAEMTIRLNTTSYPVRGFLNIEYSSKILQPHFSRMEMIKQIAVYPDGQNSAFPENFVEFVYRGEDKTRILRCSEKFESQCLIDCMAIGEGNVTTSIWRLPQNSEGQAVQLKENNIQFPFDFYTSVSTYLNLTVEEDGEIRFQCRASNGPGETLTEDIRVILFTPSMILREDTGVTRVNETALTATCVALLGTPETTLNFTIVTEYSTNGGEDYEFERTDISPDTVSTEGAQMTAQVSLSIHSELHCSPATINTVTCNLNQKQPDTHEILYTEVYDVQVPYQWKS